MEKQKRPEKELDGTSALVETNDPINNLSYHGEHIQIPSTYGTVRMNYQCRMWDPDIGNLKGLWRISRSSFNGGGNTLRNKYAVAICEIIERDRPAKLEVVNAKALSELEWDMYHNMGPEIAQELERRGLENIEFEEGGMWTSRKGMWTGISYPVRIFSFQSKNDKETHLTYRTKLKGGNK